MCVCVCVCVDSRLKKALYSFDLKTRLSSSLNTWLLRHFWMISVLKQIYYFSKTFFLERLSHTIYFFVVSIKIKATFTTNHWSVYLKFYSIHTHVVRIIQQINKILIIILYIYIYGRVEKPNRFRTYVYLTIKYSNFYILHTNLYLKVNL